MEVDGTKTVMMSNRTANDRSQRRQMVQLRRIFEVQALLTGKIATVIQISIYSSDFEVNLTRRFEDYTINPRIPRVTPFAVGFHRGIQP